MSGLQPILRRSWFSVFWIIGCVLPLLMLWVSPVLAGRTQPVSSSCLPFLNQATQQTSAHSSKNDGGRPLSGREESFDNQELCSGYVTSPAVNQKTKQAKCNARKAPQATPKKQRVKRGQDYLTQLKELDIPESAKTARTRLVATLQDKKITCGQTFVDRVRDVCIWEKTRSKSADVPIRGRRGRRGRRGAELPPDVSRQFLGKSHIYFSSLATAGTPAQQAINTSCLTGLMPKRKAAIKRFLDFQDDDIKELAESGSVRAFTALNQQFPENLQTFKDFIDLFGEGENTIPKTHVSRFTSMHHGKGVKGLALRAQAFWDWLQGKGWVNNFASISGVLNLQGIPDTGNSEDPVAKGLEDFLDLFGEEENRIPRAHLSRFTSMHSSKGTEGLAPRTQAFWDWLQDKGRVDVFASISGLLTQQGIPDTGNSADPVVKELENFFDLFGEEENMIPRTHLSRFTSMHSGKGVDGLAPQAQAFWGWLQGKGWVDDFASISGLLNRQGIPDTGNSVDPVAKGLEDFFELFGEEENNIPRKHMPRFTSMCCGKGVVGLAPQAQGFWGWLQGKGWEDDFASISGLLTQQGIPDTGNSADPVVKGLENFFALFGEEENNIPRKHLSRFTSMCCGKRVVGLAPQAQAFWDWLQDKGCVDVFASISGLLAKQGIPDTGNSADPVVKGLEDFLDLFGEGENKIPRTHLSHFTSMHCGKGVGGLAPRALTFWGWLQGKGWVDDFASISGLLGKQGIPDTWNSTDPVARELESFFGLFGEEENKIPRIHLPRFTSMHNGKRVIGLALRAQAFWDWLQGKGWVDDFASISGLLTKQGIPDAGNSADPVSKGLVNFFDLFGEGENTIPWKYLSRFTSMHSGKGVPPANQVLALWTWLDKDSVLLWQAARLFCQEGLPSLPRLNSSLDWLKQVTSWDGDDTVPLKVIALYLGAPEKKRLTRAWVSSVMAHKEGGGKGAPTVVALARLLCRHGNDGVKAYQEMVDGDSPPDSYPVIKLLLEAASVDLARMAVTEILPETGFRDASHYLAVCRNMKPAPELGDWIQIQRYIKTLIRAMTHQDNCSGEDEHLGTVRPLNTAWKIQRLYIDALWTLPPTGRQRFLEVHSVQTLLRVVRSLTALNQLARANQGDSFQQQCQCLPEYRNTHVVYSGFGELVLGCTCRFEYLGINNPQPRSGGFCDVSAGASGTGVLVRPAPEHGDDGRTLVATLCSSSC